MDAIAKRIAHFPKKDGMSVQVQHWPRMPQKEKYLVSTRVPGRSYIGHSWHESEEQAVQTAKALFAEHNPPASLRERLCTPMTIGEAAIAASTDC